MSGPHSAPELRHARPRVDPVGRREARERLLHALAGADASRLHIDRFAVLEKLGEGAHGVVYSAYDPRLDRRVALKLLRHAGGEDGLLEEARALAKLTHPNVVTVFEVGESEGDAYIAMEYVEGTDLGGWLEAQPRSPQAVLEVLIAAGRGLAHAHEHGLVHRDFKPGNVIVGRDGRVCVADFGLARLDQGRDVDDDARQSAYTGGTPAYMAPEQHRAGTVTAAADQFSFCVTAWEALARRYPFDDAQDDAQEDLEALLRAKQAGPVEPDALAGLTPGQLAALRRGMDPDPSARWGSMEALLAALGPRPRRGRGWRIAGLVAAGLAVAVAGALALRWQDRAARVAACEARGAAIDEYWDARAREGVVAGIERTGVGYAEATAQRVVPRIDAAVGAWRDGQTQACTKAEVDGSWDAATAARAQWCLDERRLEVKALVQTLQDADATVVRNAVHAAAGLEPVSPCLDSQHVGRLPEPPAEIGEALLEARASLVRGHTLQAAGRFEPALALAREVAEEAEQRGWARVAAQARTLESELLDALGSYPEAEAAGIEAYLLAVEAGAWAVAAEASVSLIGSVGARQSRHAEGELWARLSEVAAKKSGDPLGLSAYQRARQLGNLRREMGDYARSGQELEQALAKCEAVFDPGHPEVAGCLNDLAVTRLAVGDAQGARTLLERALSIREDALGPEHPDVATTHHNLAGALRQQAAFDEAEQHYARALEIREASLGPEHPSVANVLDGWALLRATQGDAPKAEALFERALQIRTAALGDEDPLVAQTLHNLAGLAYRTGEIAAGIEHATRAVGILEQTLGDQHPKLVTSTDMLASLYKESGDLAKARALRERALSIAEVALDPEHPKLVVLLHNLAGDHAAVGEHEASAALLRRTLQMMEARRGPQHPLLVPVLANLSTDQVALGQPAQALASLQRGVEICETRTCDPLDDGPIRFALAKALREAGEPERARELATQARAAHVRDGAGEAAVAEVDAWLAAL